MKKDAIKKMMEEADTVIALSKDEQYYGAQDLAVLAIEVGSAIPNDARWFIRESELPPLSRALRFAITIAPEDSRDRAEWERMLADIKKHL